MLIKQLFNGPDYHKTLRTRLILGIAFLAVGLTGLTCYFLFINGSTALSDHARSFYAGAATGITTGAVVLLIRTVYLMTHPAARKKAQIKDQDEREQTIINKASQYAGLITFFLVVAAVFVVVAFSRTVAAALVAVMAVYSLSFLAANLYLSKRL